MFSALSSIPALPRPLGDAVKERRHLVFKRLSALPKLAGVTAASRLEIRPAPQMVSSGIPAMDALTGGLPRGCLSEICGPASSGRTSVLVAALAAATRREEVCALVDTTDAFDPLSAVGANFERLLWVRCGVSKDQKAGQRKHAACHAEHGACHAEHSGSFAKRNSRGVEASLSPRWSVPEIGILRSARNDSLEKNDGQFQKLEQALRVTDLLLQSGGFGMIAIDLGDVSMQAARRIPLTSWFRFQRAVENTQTVLFVIGQAPCAQTCATLLVKLQSSRKKPSAFSHQPSEEILPSHARIFEGLRVEGELLRSRLERKPPASVTVAFTAKARWAG